MIYVSLLFIVFKVHMIEFDDENNKLDPKMISHPFGEVWKLTSSPHDKLIASVYSTNKRSPDILQQTAILRLPETDDLDDTVKDSLEFQDAEVLNTEAYGCEIKTTEFHPTDPNLLATIIDNKILIFNRAESKSQVVAEMSGKNSLKFSGGKWSQHHQGNQFIAIYENGIRSYDIRDGQNHMAWQIEEAHTQPVRDIDCNPNKPFHVATVGDDSMLKIWDIRNSKEAVFKRNDHQHWIFSVRFNTFHDQLILTSSSDGKVILTCANSCSSESPALQVNKNSFKNESGTTDEDESDGKNNKEYLDDGLLQTFDQHEDSVYCVEWSAADPWIFASLSYDGRVIISRVPKQYKYRILL